MKDNGTDRDIALKILNNIRSIASLIDIINRNQFGPIIFTQPTNQTASSGSTVTFTVVADKVTAYQWQVYNGSGWANSTATGATSNSISTTAVSPRDTYKYRCRLTGAADVTIYTDEVSFSIS